MIADQNFCDIFFMFFYPTASATAYGRRPKFVRAEHLAAAEGENCAYGPTLWNLYIILKAHFWLFRRELVVQVLRHWYTYVLWKIYLLAMSFKGTLDSLHPLQKLMIAYLFSEQSYKLNSFANCQFRRLDL